MIKELPAIETKDEYEKLIVEKIDNKKEIATPNSERYSNEIDNVWNMNNRIIDLYVENIKQDQALRSKYAEILIKILVFELIVLVFVFVLKGMGWLNYSDSTLNIFITGGIAEVFVLVGVIVRYLFQDNLTEMFKIIIENNNRKYIKDKNSKINRSTDKR